MYVKIVKYDITRKRDIYDTFAKKVGFFKFNYFLDVIIVFQIVISLIHYGILNFLCF